MGFYNIYKIFKDMIRTIFGSRFLRILFIGVIASLGVLFFFGDKVNAVEIDGVTYPDFDILLGQYITDTGHLTPSVNIVKTNNGATLLTFSYTGYYGGVYNPFIVASGTYRATGFYNMRSYILQNDSWVLSSNYINNNNWTNYQLFGNDENNWFYNSTDVFLNGENYVWRNAMSLEPPIAYPEILTNTSDLEDLLFDVLRINAYDFSNDDIYLLCYDKNFQGTESYKNLYPVSEFLLNKSSKYYVPDRTEDPDNGAIYWVDRTEIGFNWAIGNTYSFKFAIRTPVESEFSDWDYEYIGSELVFTISSNVLQSVIDDLNAQTQETLKNQQHKETLNSINNIENAITDPTIDNNSIELPTDDTTDLTRDGVNNIFTMIYNGFTTGEPVDIVLPFGIINNSMTIPAHYLEDIMNNNNFSVLANLIRVFYWYIISRFIIKDIMKKIEKIKQGDLEHVEDTNVKGEML